MCVFLLARRQELELASYRPNLTLALECLLLLIYLLLSKSFDLESVGMDVCHILAFNVCVRL